MTVSDAPPPARRLLLSVEGITLEQVEDWMPACGRDTEGRAQPRAPLPGQQPLPIWPSGGPAGPSPASRPAQHSSSSSRAAARLAGSAAAIILECLSGRRALPHLRMMCTQRAYDHVHSWPRGPGWARASIVSSPHVDGWHGAVEAVILIDVEGHTVAMAISLRRSCDGWLVDDAELAVNRGVSALLGGKPLSSPYRGSA